MDKGAPVVFGIVPDTIPNKEPLSMNCLGNIDRCSYMYTYICIETERERYIYIYMFVCMDICMYIHMRIHTYVYTSIALPCTEGRCCV